MSNTDEAKADVLVTVNDSIQELGDGVRELSTAIKQGLPDAWDIMVRQQTNDAIGDLTVAVVLWFVLAICHMRFSKSIKRWRKELVELEESEHDPYGDRGRKINNLRDTINGVVIGRPIVLGIILFLTAAAINSANVFQKMANPEYYAAKDLVNTILVKGK